MKAIYFICAILLLNTLAHAQEQKGIEFTKGLSWTQVKEKAKNENKYIFLDGYTTWCGPCKQMAREVFPQAAVGEFFNKNFLNVAVQFDVTKKDGQEVKNWYKDAAAIAKNYKINSYPTYLFFNPAGELVHSIHSAILDPDEFIGNAKQALDPKSQYLSLKRQFEAGKREPEFLQLLLTSALAAWDNEMIPLATAAYLKTKPDLLTESNLKILSRITKKSSDPGFNVFLNHAEQADLVIGKGHSADIVKTIIFDELVLPVLRIGGAKKEMGMMSFYTGELSKNVDWAHLKAQLDSKFPKYSEELLLSAKLTYLDWSENWKELNTAIYKSLGTGKNSISPNQLNTLANKIFLVVTDKMLLEETLTWAKLNLANLQDKTDKINFMVTYADLLNKADHKDQAIKQLESAVELTDGKTQYLIDLLEKMRKGKS